MTTLSGPSDLQTKSALSNPSVTIESAAPKRAPGRARGERVKLTIAVLQRMQPGDVARDSAQPGFYAECGARGIVFKISGDLARGNTVRMKIGDWPGCEISDARRQAHAALLEIKAGRDPRKPKLDAHAAPAAVTVRVSIARYVEYLTIRQRGEKTIRFTKARLTDNLPELLDVPIVDLLPSQCQAAHARLMTKVTDAKGRRKGGPVAANKTLRDLRAVWNLAYRQSDAPESFPRRCPVASVTFAPEDKRRDAVIPDLPGWWRRTGDMRNPLRAVMFRLGLLSGLRMSNVGGCRREWLDLTEGQEVIVFPASAMKSRQPFVMPLSLPMVELVRRALELGPTVVGAPDGGGWLFPSLGHDAKTIVASSNWTERGFDSNEVGHSLWHTYSTLARSTPGVTADNVERLLAHAVAGVAGHYYHPDAPETLAHLRAAQALVSARILAACGAKH